MLKKMSLSFCCSYVSGLSGSCPGRHGAARSRWTGTSIPSPTRSYRKLINIEPDGKKKEFTLFSVKKGLDKVAALFIAPASDKGRSTLRLGDNMWLYIPNVGKPIRITSLQSVVGGVFNNADILQPGLYRGVRRRKR